MNRIKLYHNGDWKKLFWFLFVLFIILRLAYLNADPPEQLNWAWGEWVDAGSYSYNARNKALFGTWELDDWNLMWVSPIPHWITYFIFTLLGVGFWQNNMVPALFSIGTVFVFYHLLRIAYSTVIAYAGTILIGFNYLMITYARVGNRVSEMIFFLVLSAYFWQKGFSKLFYFYLAGIVSMCAFFSKGSMIVFFIAMFLASMVSPIIHFGWKQWKKWVYPSLLYLLGILTLVIFWYLVLVLPHTRIYDIFIGKDIKFRTPFSWDKLLGNIWQTPIAHYFFMYIPIIFIFSLLFILKISYHIVERIKKINPDEAGCANPNSLEVLALLWYLGDFFFNTIINYRPLRFFVSSVPPLIILFIALLSYLWRFRSLKIPKIGIFYLLVVFIWAFFTLHYFINENTHYLYSTTTLKMFSYIMLPPPYNYYEAFKTLLLFSLIFSLACYIAALLLRGKTLRISTFYSRIICILIFAGSVCYQISLYYDWVNNYKNYKIINYSRFLLEAVPEGPISGNIAPMLCFENEFKAYLIYQDRNNWYNHPFERYGITHMQMARPHDERDGYFSNFIEIMRKSRIAATFPLKGRMEELWRINPPLRSHISYQALSDNAITFKNNDTILRHSLWIIPSSSPSAGEVITLPPAEIKTLNYKIKEIIIKPADYNFEIEQMKREVGMPVYDLDASRSIAVRSDMRPHSLIYVQEHQLESGRYQVFLRVKYDKPTADFKKIELRFYREDGDQFAQLFFPTDSTAVTKYTTLTGTFYNPLNQQITIEISNPETDNMLFDILQVIPVTEAHK